MKRETMIAAAVAWNCRLKPVISLFISLFISWRVNLVDPILCFPVLLLAATYLPLYIVRRETQAQKFSASQQGSVVSVCLFQPASCLFICHPPFARYCLLPFTVELHSRHLTPPLPFIFLAVTLFPFELHPCTRHWFLFRGVHFCSELLFMLPQSAPHQCIRLTKCMYQYVMHHKLLSVFSNLSYSQNGLGRTMVSFKPCPCYLKALCSCLNAWFSPALFICIFGGFFLCVCVEVSHLS